TVPDSTTGEIHENSLRCIPTQYAQGIIFDILLAFTLNRTVLRPGEDVEILKTPNNVSGEDVLPGFVLNLNKVW
ncbi:MAG: Uma2 family endonuclease, partial [Gloeocapsa sp. UFS-A4-WI-NPMV-4B04]|nr:Uma2 family endonuclease [Gloeocapsa sp. UFS-A4-WI-NPMV-4B04]